MSLYLAFKTCIQLFGTWCEHLGTFNTSKLYFIIFFVKPETEKSASIHPHRVFSYAFSSFSCSNSLFRYSTIFEEFWNWFGVILSFYEDFMHFFYFTVIFQFLFLICNPVRIFSWFLLSQVCLSVSKLIWFKSLLWNH